MFRFTRVFLSFRIKFHPAAHGSPPHLATATFLRYNRRITGKGLFAMKYLYTPEITTQNIWTVIGDLRSALTVWMILMCILSFFLMRSDKQRARTRSARRIPEKHLFLAALLGGSAGAMLGMLVFHHKTEKWYFALGMPLILLVQIAAWLLL